MTRSFPESHHNDQADSLSPSHSGTQRVRALCCECGALRTVSSAYIAPGRRYVFTEALGHEALARCQARGLYADTEPHWRCLTELKCSACGVRTRHAMLRDGEPAHCRDYADSDGDRWVSRRRSLDAAISEAREFGIRVWELDKVKTSSSGRRARVEAGRYLDDGVFYVCLFQQTPTEALSALQVAMRRLLRFERERWHVEIGERFSTACVLLCDLPDGIPMEAAADVRQTMIDDALTA